METYKPTIGIEVHAELKTKTKMFCDCKNDPHAGEANAYVCPVCMAHPGTLPVVNKEAVKHVLTVGVAIQSTLASYTEFDRKNYFYPDIPKGYQISQYLYPLVKGGSLAGVSITRVHLEEDTARSQHESSDGSLVDYNRAGVPLMELVTEPVIHDAKTAGDFARELQLLLRTLGVSDANMERGEMRVEANISVSKNETLGTKVEVKNLNSFKAVENAIEYEVKRHIELLENGDKIIQETRGWDDAKGKTFPQRLKESANDYRYFPDPDIPKFDIGKIHEFSVSRLSENMPALPEQVRIKYRELGLTREQIEMIISDADAKIFFENSLQVGGTELARLIANYLTTDISAYRASGIRIESMCVHTYVELMRMVFDSLITSRVAKDILPEVLSGAHPREIAESQGLIQSNETDVILPVVMSILAENPEVVALYRSGKTSAIQFLIGQGMKATKGSANPAVLKELFEKELTR